MPGPVTLRQAKAAHKAKGGPSVSERDLRILQREIQLDRRAWATKEREKSRSAARKGTVADEQRHKADEAARLLGTQRRCDKFGYKSSQFHLGAFFTKASAMTSRSDVVARCDVEPVVEEDFLDDESLFDAIQDVEAVRQDRTRVPGLVDEELDWTGFLDTGSQIERELEQTNMVLNPTLDGDDASQKTSFDSTGSPGLTTQDLEALDATTLVQGDVEEKTARPEDGNKIPSAISAHRHEQGLRNDESASKQHSEFSNTQLEKFVDEDIVLSQI